MKCLKFKKGRNFGLSPILLLLLICSFAQVAVSEEVDYLELEWPLNWTVFGSVSHEIDAPLLDRFSELPTTIRVGSLELSAIPTHSEAGGVDLESLFLKHAEQNEYVRHAGDSAYLFAEIHCKESGVLLAGAGADWWMQWAVDGQVVLDTLATGNNTGELAYDNHPFRIELTPGKHLISVLVRSGSSGWSVQSDGASSATRERLISAEYRRDHAASWEREKQKEFEEAIATNSRRKVVVYGSSVARGSRLGWANRLGEVLEERNWEYVNKSVSGDTTSKLLARFNRDLLPEKPDVVVIALSLANEGVFGDSPDLIYQQYLRNLRKLVQLLRKNGIVPVVGNCYPNERYAEGRAKYARKFNEELAAWPIYSFDFMGAIGNGHAQWAPDSSADAAHPNDYGYDEMTRAIPPSVFDNLIGSDFSTIRPTSSWFKKSERAGNFLRCQPDRELHSFTYGFELRCAEPPETALILGGFERWTLWLTPEGRVECRSAEGNLNLVSKRSVAKKTQIAVAYSYGRSELMLYVDGEVSVLSGVKFASQLFYLAGTPDEAGPAGDYRNCTLHYAALNSGMIQKNFKTGRISYSSLALFAPLDDLVVAPSLRMINLAPTELRLQVQEK